MNEITHRTKTRPVRVGDLTIGGNNEVIIQSMTTTKTHDVEATVAEITPTFAFELLSHMKGGPSIEVLLDLALGDDCLYRGEFSCFRCSGG